MADVIEPNAGSDRSLRELLSELWENTEKLVHQEFELAVAELDVRMDRAKTQLTQAVIGGAILYAGVLTLVAAVVLLLAEFLAPWLAALFVAMAALLGGYLLLQKGKKALEPTKVVPERTVQNVKRDVQMFKEATK